MVGDGAINVIFGAFILSISIISACSKVTIPLCRKRFFSIFQWPESEDVSFKEVIYVGATIFISLIIRLT